MRFNYHTEGLKVGLSAYYMMNEVMMAHKDAAVALIDKGNSLLNWHVIKIGLGVQDYVEPQPTEDRYQDTPVSNQD